MTKVTKTLKRGKISKKNSNDLLAAIFGAGGSVKFDSTTTTTIYDKPAYAFKGLEDGATLTAAFVGLDRTKSAPTKSDIATAGGAGTITLPAKYSDVDNAYFYEPHERAIEGQVYLLYATGGTGAGTYAVTTGYDGTTKVLTTASGTFGADTTFKLYECIDVTTEMIPSGTGTTVALGEYRPGAGLDFCLLDFTVGTGSVEIYPKDK